MPASTAKPKKGPAKVSSRPLTDYFTRKSVNSSQPSSSQPKSSQGQSQPLPLSSIKRNPPPRPDQEIISLSSESHISISSGTHSVMTISSDASNRPNTRGRADTSVDLMESISNAKTSGSYLAPPFETSRKLSRSPDSVQYLGTGKVSKAGPTSRSAKRKSKFDDSDVEQLDSVVYVRSPAATRKSVASAPIPPRALPLTSKENLNRSSSHIRPTPKKPRLASPEPPRLHSLEPLHESDDPVPSSQSDEHELEPRGISCDPDFIMADVDKWRHDASSPMSLPMSEHQDRMDVDDASGPSNASSPTFLSETEVSANLKDTGFSSRQSTPTPIVHEPLTPPPTHGSTPFPFAVTPVALDRETKTAILIADIKARAMAAALSSPEEVSLPEFKDELDESSDEDDLLPWGPSVATLSTRQKEPPSGPSTSSSTGAGRYNLRRHAPSSPLPVSRPLSPSPSSSGRSRATRSVNKGKGKASVKKKGHNPLDMLLKEKKRADQSGKGTEAFQLAEDAVAGRSLMQIEMDSEERTGETGDWTNEDAARRAVKEGERMGYYSSSSPSADGNFSEGLLLDKESRKRLVGEKCGDEIEGILRSDRENTTKDKDREKVLGVPFWEEHEGHVEDKMEVEEPILYMGDAGGHPVLKSLKAAVERGDVAQTVLLLDSGVFATLDLTRYGDIVPYLCELALSPRETPLTVSAFHVLRHIWNNPRPLAAGISLADVITTIARLGARTAVMNAMGWTTAPTRVEKCLRPQHRDEVLYRLVVLLTLSARAGKLTTTEGSDLLMVLLNIGMDPTASQDLQREIILAVDAICRSLASELTGAAAIECAICTRLLGYAINLTPINKRHLVSFLSSGGEHAARIARWVAHHLITGEEEVSTQQYRDLPPLIDLLDPLSARSCYQADSSDKKQTRGMFELHEKTDYVDMGFYAQILAVAISNVDGYVEEDRATSQEVASVSLTMTPGSPGKQSVDKPDTPLQLVRSAVLNLHSRIVDTRAAFLDRSRTKAILKALELRIDYQRMAALRSKKGPGRKNLRQYFGQS